MRPSGIWNRLIVSTVAAAFLATLTAAIASAQWPTTCVGLTDERRLAHVARDQVG